MQPTSKVIFIIITVWCINTYTAFNIANMLILGVKYSLIKYSHATFYTIITNICSGFSFKLFNIKITYHALSFIVINTISLCVSP